MLPKGLRAFIELLNSSGVEYVIVGGFALDSRKSEWNALDSGSGANGPLTLCSDGIPVHFSGGASGRTKDRADLEALGAE